MNTAPDLSTRQFRFAVNTQGQDKQWNWETLATQYKDIQGTIYDVQRYVKSGHALCAGLLGEQRRSKANVIGSEWLLLDIDNSASLKDENGKPVLGDDDKAIKVYSHQLTLDEAIDHPFVQQYCALIYTTASHKPDWHKFRLVFLLPRYVEGSEAVEAMVRLLMERFPHDPACKDASRVFYGNTAATFPHINPNACLPADWLDQAIALANEEKARKQAQLVELAAKREQFRQLVDDEGWDTDDLIQQALTFIPPRQPGAGNYDECRQVLMALVDHYGSAEGAAIAEQWSPSIPGTTWNIDQKVRSFRRSGITIGTLFKIAQDYGFRFPERKVKLQQDPREPSPHEYQKFEAIVAELNQALDFEEMERQRQRKERYRKETERIQVELNTIRVHPTIKESGLFIPQGLVQLPQQSGIIITDAGMGARKTSVALKDLLQQHRERYDKALRWAFTPTNLLGLQASQIFRLPHHTKISRHDNRFEGVSCLESIGAIDLAKLPDSPPLILFDEPSGTFPQILKGDTCRDWQPFVIGQIRKLGKAVAERGGWIVLSEDDVTNLELDFIAEASGLEVVEYLKFKKTVIAPRRYEIYDSPSLTWEELLIRYERGENVCFAADSQRHLLETERWLQGLGIDATFIHGDNSSEQWAHDCIQNPTPWIYRERPRFFGYSPAMGSGASIEDPEGWFSGMAFYFSHLEPRQAKQMCDRLRTDVPRFGYVKERGAIDDDLFSGCRPDLILRDLRRNKQGVEKLTQFAEYASSKQSEDIKLLEAMHRLEQDWDQSDSDLGFYLKHWSRYQARETYNKLSLRDGLIATWEEQGHTVKRLELGAVKHLVEERQVIRDELDHEEAIAWTKADTSTTSISQARDILNTLGSTKEDRLVARKRLMEDKLPGTPLDDVEFVLKTIVHQNGRFLKTVEMLWMAKHPEAAKYLDRWNWTHAFTQSAKTDRIVIVHRLTNRSAQAKLLNECPVMPFIEGKISQWDNNTPEAIAVHEWALLHSRQFRRHLRLSISESHQPVQTVNKILRKLGYEVVQQGWKGSREDRQRQYRITNLQDIERDIILKALSERFLQRCQDVGETPPESVIATRIGNPLSTSCDHGSEIDSRLMASDSLADIRQWLELAKDDPAVLAEIRKLIPPEVLKRAIA